MIRSKKNEYVANLNKDLSNSSTVIVAHYNGLNVQETEELRKDMRNNGATFKITKNTLTKLALANTQNDVITDLFSGPTAIAYSADSLIPVKVTVAFEKKFKNFKILGGAYEGEKIDEERIKFLASLPSLDEIRGKLVGLISTPAQKIASVLQAPASQIARLMSSRSTELEKTN